MQYETATNYILWSNFHCSRDETRPNENSSIRRPPYPWKSQTITIISRFNSLFTTLSPQFGFQDHIFKRTNLHWDWNPSTDAKFHRLKQWICNTLLKTTLVYFDPTKSIVIQTDDSEYGLGAAFLQDGRPLAFASKILTDVKTQYNNIKHECLSVCFGLEKFHTYIYGRHITVHNDQKPLEMIQKKPIHTAPPHLQRMLLCLQKSDYTIQYKPGKETVLADRLSTFPSRKENMPIKLNQNIHNIYFAPYNLNIEELWREILSTAPYTSWPWMACPIDSKKFPT